MRRHVSTYKPHLLAAKGTDPEGDVWRSCTQVFSSWDGNMADIASTSDVGMDLEAEEDFVPDYECSPEKEGPVVDEELSVEKLEAQLKERDAQLLERDSQLQERDAKIEKLMEQLRRTEHLLKVVSDDLQAEQNAPSVGVWDARALDGFDTMWEEEKENRQPKKMRSVVRVVKEKCYRAKQAYRHTKDVPRQGCRDGRM